jgi:signal recognition particle subunit SRP54
MFESLTEKVMSGIKSIRGQSKITEKNIEDSLREIRLALLEADVNFKVVKIFIDRVKEKALGQMVGGGITAGQQFVKIVHDELVTILGGGTSRLEFKETPSFLFMVGLQGAGKTTTSAKLSVYLQKQFNKRVGMVSVDVYRPSAIEQLKILAEKTNSQFLEAQADEKPEQILERAKTWAKDKMLDIVIVDTAGRLQIAEDLMQELVRLKEIAPPSEVLLVADAMLGQQSVNVAEGFHQKMGLTGLILTKVDGDARGGAALSIREAVGVPIKFMGVGEKTDALEVFHPDRLAGRILDMGDVLSLVEKAAEVIDEKSAKDAVKKMARNQFTVEDFLAQIQQIKKLGSMEGIMKMIPGMGQAMKQMKGMAPPEKEIKKIEAIIRSMTLQERQDLDILNGSRRIRIAKGSGTQVSDVNKFVKQFNDAKKMMSQLMKFGLGGKGGGPFGGRGMGFPF